MDKCEDSEIWHLLVFVINESGVLVESYGRINIKNASLQYYMEMGNLSKNSSRTTYY